MHTRTPGSTNTRGSYDRRARLIAIVALAAAALALIVPASLRGHRGNEISAAPKQASIAPSGPTTYGRERVSRFFGFLEFDWDPDAPGGVPGFDPWPQAPQQP